MSTGRKLQRRRERAIAVGLTLSVYSALFFFLTRPSPVPPFRGTDFGERVSLALVGMGKAASATSQSDPLEALAQDIARSSTAPLPTAAPEQRARTSLSDLFGPESKAAAAPSAAAGGEPNGRVRTGLIGDPGAQISGGRRNVAVGPDGQIPPCWRQPERRVPVRISIILDQKGGMIGPPEILRARNARNDDAQRAAETIAMRAMAGCAPFTLASAAGSYRTFELDFSRERDWIRPTGLVELR